jgi:adenylosuccinate synthase
VRLCTGYRLGGRTLDEMPVDLDDLAAAEPIMEELPGWTEQSGASMPTAAAAFVDRVSALTGIPVWATSWGPGRLQTIVTQDPFSKGPFSKGPFNKGPFSDGLAGR